MARAHFRFHLAAPAAPLPHIWEHTVGSCHATLALRADWQASIRSHSALRIPSFLRTRTKDGRPIVKVSPMIATTIMISIRVNPAALLNRVFTASLCLTLWRTGPKAR